MRTALLLSLLIVLVAAAPAAGAERRVPHGWLGVTLDGPFEPGDRGEWNRIVTAGAESVRTSFVWSRIQPYATDIELPAGKALPRVSGIPTDFAASDAMVAAAARRRLSVLPVVQSAPAWAAVAPIGPNSAPADYAAVRRFFTALVRRYGPRGSFWSERPGLPRMPIRTWQVFNEPNITYFWVQPFAPTYVTTLKAAARGIRAADRWATIVLGGLTNFSWDALAKVYAAGARGYFDAVAIHPYTNRPSNVLRILRRARTVMRANGDWRLPLWVTELGWTGAGSKVSGARVFHTDDRQQARRLDAVLPQLARARKRLRIARLFWYTWLSTEGRTSEWGYSGLRRVRAGHKIDAPVMAVFRRHARRLEGCRKAPRSARACA